MNSFSDEELIRRYLETRHNAYFGQLYERYCQKVYRKCLSFTKDSSQADDLTQDIFLRLFSRLDGYKQQAKFSTWLYTIAHNYCTDHVRSPRRRYEQQMTGNNDDLLMIANDEFASLDEQSVRAIERAMMLLAPEEQLMLQQKYQHELSISDMAHTYHLTESALKMRLKRSRDRLRQYYYMKINDFNEESDILRARI